MKKKILKICMIMLCTLSLAACSSERGESDSGLIKKAYTINAVIELNENSNMGLELLSDMSDKEYTKIEEADGRTRVYCGYYLTTGFCGVYPENEEKSVITTIFINDTKCDIFGIKKGDSVDVIQDVISKHNYSLNDDKEIDGIRYFHYRKEDIRIVFACEEDVIISMAVDLMGYEDISEDMLTVDGDIITEYSIDAAMELNANSNMGLELLNDMTDRKYKKTIQGGRTKVYSGYYLTTGFCGYYPEEDKESEVIISISIEGSECHLFGIKEGDNIDDVSDVMLNYGYNLEEDKEYNNARKTIYRKGDVCVSFLSDGGEIISIVVYFERYDDTQEEVIVY